MADLQDLFARLKSSGAGQTSSPATQFAGSGNSQHHYQAPSVSSPIYSPAPGGPQPHHPSAVMSPNLPSSMSNTPGAEQAGVDRQKNLLNLLKFSNAPSQSNASGQQSQASGPASPSEAPAPPNRNYSASDLVASFVRKPSSSIATHTPINAVPTTSRQDGSGSAQASTSPQDFLLKLLNNPKPAQSDLGADPVESPRAPRSHERADDAQRPVRSPPEFDGGLPQAHTFQPPQPAKKTPFTYVNPFEQLSASSPRNRSPRPGTQPSSGAQKMEILKHAEDDASRMEDVTHQHSNGRSARPQKSPAKPSPRTVVGRSSADGRKSPRHEPTETVSEALNDVAEEVDRQVEQMLGYGDDEPEIKQEDIEEMREVEKAVKEVAAEMKEELADSETRETLRQSVPDGVVDVLEEVIDDVEHANIADSWESAADDSPTKDEPRVQIFNLPLKPFIAVELTGVDTSPVAFRPTTVIGVSKQKKDFDQIDRTLVTATRNYIAYGLSKPGGFRLLRQEDARDKHVFQSTKERIFNLSICRPAHLRARPGSMESVIATGVNGSVFWAELPPPEADAFDAQEMEQSGFIFPPDPGHDDNTSGSQLRTRAKKSNRHPEFFAIGRGRSIHIIFPVIARSSKYTKHSTRVCNTTKYLKDKCLKIDTGKAGKDFTFSEDDSVIASLDKAGRLRFWDIRSLVVRSSLDYESDEPVDVTLKEPFLTYATTSPSDKSWPTSVLFLDKDRPTTKGTALRYLIVGMKQNHTLQLWDIGLGKPVQEISFPHENESDGICSVSYHAKTGMLVVGHPTRNSIYLINVSAPKYSLPSMTQAKFFERLTGQDDPLPKPDSTAIMGSVREFSFAGKGQLRSVEVLNDPTASSENYEPQDAPLFELYVMHSKGVTCFGVKKEDLYWDVGNKTIDPAEAEKAGHILIKAIKVVPQSEPSEPSTNGDQPAPTPSSARSSAREPKKENAGSVRATQSQTPEAAVIASTLARVENKQDQARAAMMNGPEKSEKSDKKKKKRSAATDTASQTSATQTVQRGLSPIRQKEAMPSAGAAEQLSEKELKKVEETLAAEVSRAMEKEVTKLYRRIDEDRRVQDAANNAKQDALLRLVSSTLTENVQDTLSHIVNSSVQQNVIPFMGERISTSFDSNLSAALGPAFQATISRDLRTSLPDSVNRAMQEPDVIRNISDLVAAKVLQQIGTQLSASLRETIGPVLSETTWKAAEQAASQSERRLRDQLRQAELQRQADSAKIERLTTVVTGLTQTVQTMADSQTRFQTEILEQRNHAAQQSREVPAEPASQVPVKTPEDEELEQITTLMNEGRFEEGTIMWLQSGRQAELFDHLFVRCNPSYTDSLTSLVSLSVCAAVSASLETNLSARLTWLETVLNGLNPADPEISDVCSKILDITHQRLSAAYMQLSNSEPSNPLLRRIYLLTRKCTGLKEAIPYN